jgi:hypothetical protein
MLSVFKDTKNGAWNVKQARLLEGQGSRELGRLKFCRNLNSTQVQSYAQDLASCCRALGKHFSFFLISLFILA